MPYIKVRDQSDFCAALDALPNFLTPGELNYVITKILLKSYPTRYEDFNKLIGVLECCKLEFYRRAVAAYEDKKIEENGDVYL